MPTPVKGQTLFGLADRHFTDLVKPFQECWLRKQPVPVTTREESSSGQQRRERRSGDGETPRARLAGEEGSDRQRGPGSGPCDRPGPSPVTSAALGMRETRMQWEQVKLSTVGAMAGKIANVFVFPNKVNRRKNSS